MRSRLGSAADLTSRARIRDAAIDVFGDRGFDTGVRAIAAAAGVSAGLVNHHFGSKDGLRAACDDWVREFIRAEKSKAITSPTPAGMIAAMAEIEVYAPTLAYLLRSFSAGGPLAESLLEQMISDAEQMMRAGVEAGRFKPSRNEAARARYLTLSHVGAVNLHLQMRRAREGKIDYRNEIRVISDLFSLPALEMHTQGVFTDSSVMDTFTEEN